MIYFIQSSDNFIKIGYSANPAKRLASLQTSAAEPLILLGTVTGGRDKEEVLHDRFSHLRISGEWFRPDQELLDYIEHSKEDLSEEEGSPYSDRAIDIVSILGKNIKLARLRRHMTMQQLADRMGTGVRAVYNIERGTPAMSLANYVQALICLGLEREIENIAHDDPVGRKIADDELLSTRGTRGDCQE